MVDYNAAGILTVLLFYFFRKKTWISFAAQLVGLYYLNVVMLGNLYYPVTILGHHFEIAQQSFALLALIPIWLYHGRDIIARHSSISVMRFIRCTFLSCLLFGNGVFGNRSAAEILDKLL